MCPWTLEASHSFLFSALTANIHFPSSNHLPILWAQNPPPEQAGVWPWPSPRSPLPAPTSPAELVLHEGDPTHTGPTKGPLKGFKDQSLEREAPSYPQPLSSWLWGCKEVNTMSDAESRDVECQHQQLCEETLSFSVSSWCQQRCSCGCQQALSTALAPEQSFGFFPESHFALAYSRRVLKESQHSGT